MRATTLCTNTDMWSGPHWCHADECHSMNKELSIRLPLHADRRPTGIRGTHCVFTQRHWVRLQSQTSSTILRPCRRQTIRWIDDKFKSSTNFSWIFSWIIRPNLHSLASRTSSLTKNLVLLKQFCILFGRKLFGEKLCQDCHARLPLTTEDYSLR